MPRRFLPYRRRARAARRLRALSGGRPVTPNYPAKSPDQIASLRLWLRADLGLFQDDAGTTPAPNDNDPVGLWQDLSGQDNHASQPTAASRPLLKTNAFNGRPAVRFDGSNDYLDVAAFLDGDAYNNAFSLFLATRKGPAAAGNDISTSAGNFSAWLSSRDHANAEIIANRPVQFRYPTGGQDDGLEWATYGDDLLCLGWRNRGSARESSAGMGFAASPGSPLRIGALLSSAVDFFNGDIAELCLFNARLTGDDFHGLLSYLNARYGPYYGADSEFLLFEGDSLTQGSGSTGGQAYPEQCMALLGANYYGLAVGRAGEQISEAAPDAAAQVDAYYRGAAFPRDAVVFWAGTNDFYFEAGQATVRTRYQNYCAARRAAGWKVIAATLLPRQDAGVPAGHEAERTSFNAWLREGWPGFADALADVGAIAELQDPTDTNYYAADKVHLVNAGYALVAAEVAAAVLTL